MKVYVEGNKGNWIVRFSFGNQTFSLPSWDTKRDAMWMAMMLRKCFKNYKDSITR